MFKELAESGLTILKKNVSLAAHSTRVYVTTKKVLELEPKLVDNFSQEEVLLAALLHDLGRADWIDDFFTEPLALLKPADKYIMDCHPISGRQVAARLGAPETVQIIIEQHHERPGGRGTPNKVIDPVPAAVLIASVDAYVACLETRSYRPRPLPLKVALQEAAEKGHRDVVKVLEQISI